MENTIKLDARKIAIIGVLSALTIVLGATPLGFIPIGAINATTMHIPTIIGSLAFGPVVGGFTGLIFGLHSMFRALSNPVGLSIAFINPIVSVLPRILIGIFPYFIRKALSKINENMSITVAAFLGSMTNTVLVLGSMYLLYAEKYVEALGISSDIAAKTIAATAVTNGIPEAILAAIIVSATVKAFLVRYRGE